MSLHLLSCENLIILHLQQSDSNKFDANYEPMSTEVSKGLTVSNILIRNYSLSQQHTHI